MSQRKIGAGQYRDDQLALEHQPAYTKADEQKDLAALSIPDIVSLQSDLRGITSGMTDLNINGPNEPRQPSTVATANSSADIASLDEEMSKLPPSQTAAYRQALAKCPNLMTDERKMEFLECENNDAALAAQRWAKYWEARLELFGPNRCFLTMTLAGAMQDEMMNMINRPIQKPLPVTDTAGRVVIYMDPSHRNFEDYSIEQECMVTWYLMEAAAEDPDIRRRGAVVISDGRKMERKYYTRKRGPLWAMIFSALPIRLRAFHLCFPSKIMHYVIYPVLKHFLNSHFRFRVLNHYGSPDEVLRDLESYCLPRDRLPTELGGSVVLDINQWVKDRLALERARLTLSLSVAQASDGTAGKRLRTEMHPIKEHAAAPARAAATVPPGKKKKRKQSRGGTGDPRMMRAMNAKIANDGLSLYDVLVAGGYVFTEEPSLGDMVDADGIALKQRKNNLCRRIRMAKQKREEERDNVDSAEEQTGMTSPIFVSPAIVSCNPTPTLHAEGSEVSVPTAQQYTDDDTLSLEQGGNVPQTFMRDDTCMNRKGNDATVTNTRRKKNDDNGTSYDEIATIVSEVEAGEKQNGDDNDSAHEDDDDSFLGEIYALAGMDDDNANDDSFLGAITALLGIVNDGSLAFMDASESVEEE